MPDESETHSSAAAQSGTTKQSSSTNQSSVTTIIVALIAMVGTVTAAYLGRNSRNTPDTTKQVTTRTTEPSQVVAPTFQANRSPSVTPAEAGSPSKDRFDTTAKARPKNRFDTTAVSLPGTTPEWHDEWVGGWIFHVEPPTVKRRNVLTLKIDPSKPQTYENIHRGTLTETAYVDGKRYCEVIRHLELRPEHDPNSLFYVVLSKESAYDATNGKCVAELAGVLPNGTLKTTDFRSFQGFAYGNEPRALRVFFKKIP